MLLYIITINEQKIWKSQASTASSRSRVPQDRLLTNIVITMKLTTSLLKGVDADASAILMPNLSTQISALSVRTSQTTSSARTTPSTLELARALY